MPMSGGWMSYSANCGPLLPSSLIAGASQARTGNVVAVIAAHGD
jgi:hypothetical protein